MPIVSPCCNNLSSIPASCLPCAENGVFTSPCSQTSGLPVGLRGAFAMRCFLGQILEYTVYGIKSKSNYGATSRPSSPPPTPP
jgi:hypothetical protein